MRIDQNWRQYRKNTNEFEVLQPSKEQKIKTDKKFYWTGEMVETSFKTFERYKVESDYRVNFKYNILPTEMARRFNGLGSTEISRKVLSNEEKSKCDDSI